MSTPKTRAFLLQAKMLLLNTARKAFTSWLIASVPALLTLIQKNYGVAIGVEVAAILSGLGVYQVANKPDPSKGFGPNGEPPHS